jgi:plasmid stabilization system protein ParE
VSGKRYRLTPAAEAEFQRLRSYFAEEASPRVSRQISRELVESFRFLAQNPNAGHIRKDLAGSRTLRFWPVRDILVVYVQGVRPLTITMIVRGNRDVAFLIASRL